MKNLQKGENIALSQAGIIGETVFLGISWITDFDQQADIDVSAFLLNEHSKVVNDSNFVFYNQTEDSSGCIRLDTYPNNSEDNQLFAIALDHVPSYIRKMVFSVSLDCGEGNPQNFSCIKELKIRLFGLDSSDDNIISFSIPKCGNERSIILGEMYLHQNNWKFKAVGQGLEFGLDSLASGYGVELADENQPENSQSQKTTNQDEENLILASVEAKIKKQIKRFIPQIKRAVQQNFNESNTRLILNDIFTNILGYKKLTEIKTEVNIQGRKADYVLAVGNKDVIVVEAKKAGLPLKEEQIFQASSYGAYSGISYVLLTNLCEFLLFKIKTDGIVEHDVIFGVDFLDDIEQKDIKHLALISRQGMTHSEFLDKLSSQVIATDINNISRLLLESEVIAKIQEIIKHEQNCEVLQDQVQETIETILDLALR
jgi:stress response protein SCP2